MIYPCPPPYLLPSRDPWYRPIARRFSITPTQRQSLPRFASFTNCSTWIDPSFLKYLTVQDREQGLTWSWRGSGPSDIFFHLRTQQGPVECNKKQENFIRMRASHSSGWNVDTPVVKWAPLIISHYGRCAARFNRATGVEVSASSGRIAGSDYTSPLCSSANRYTFSFFPFFPVGLVAFLSFLVFPWTHYSTHPMPIAHFLFPPLVYDPFHLIRYYNHLSRSSVISFPSIRMLFHSNVFAFYIPLITKLSINKWE